MTQHEKIWDYLLKYRHITPMEAFVKLHIIKLSTRIGEMIKLGYPIEKRPVRYKDHSGVTVSYTEYFIFGYVEE